MGPNKNPHSEGRTKINNDVNYTKYCQLCKYRPGCHWLSVSLLEKHLDSVADHKLNMKHPWDAFFPQKQSVFFVCLLLCFFFFYHLGCLVIEDLIRSLKITTRSVWDWRIE